METPAEILENLKNNPGMVYIPSGRDAMYVLVHDSTEVMYCIPGDFSEASDESINARIQEIFK